jgi:rhodanese-related sulfurtransferase
MLFQRSESLSPTDTATAAKRGTVQLVDVRNPSELAQERIEGAIHLPLDQLSARLSELPHDRRIAFLCRSGQRSGAATRTASKAGLDAVNVEGGLIAWTKAGLPLIVGGDGR